MGKTTVKAIGLGYRDVGSSGDYTKLMGVLKGLTINQDEPESTEIEAEFYDSPFDIFYDGNPVTMTFELANYDLSELEELFGGDYDSVNDEYEGAANAFTSEHEWRLNFGRGYASLVLYKGLTIGTIKKDADGALNYSVTITALIHTTGTGTEQDPYVEHMYKIVSSLLPTTPSVINPQELTEGAYIARLTNTGESNPDAELGGIAIVKIIDDNLTMFTLVDDNYIPIAWNGNKYVQNNSTDPDWAQEAVNAASQSYVVAYHHDAIQVSEYGYPDTLIAILDMSL